MRCLLVSALTLAASACGRSNAGAFDGELYPVVALADAGNLDAGRTPEDLSSYLEPIRADAGMPALAAAAFDDQGPLGIGAVGVRKIGDATAVTSSDLWHLGSCTKAMTSTLAAQLVEEGSLSWTTTLEQAFLNDWVPNMDPAYRSVTVEQLLTHRGGAPATVGPDLWVPLLQPGDVAAQRKAFVQGLLSQPPSQAVGTYAYSNAGYLVVGALLEKVSAKSWELLMHERIFAPLGMDSCGFGPQATPGTVDQPWGHEVSGPAYVPYYGDNPPAVGPAGTVHCTLTDWGKFLAEHLRGARGETTVLGLAPATFTKLHSPVGTYALGWEVGTRSWAHGTVLSHSGSNTTNYAVVWVAPNVNRIFVSTTNAPADPSFLPANDAVGLELGRYPP